MMWGELQYNTACNFYAPGMELGGTLASFCPVCVCVCGKKKNNFILGHNF